MATTWIAGKQTKRGSVTVNDCLFISYNNTLEGLNMYNLVQTSVYDISTQFLVYLVYTVHVIFT